MSFFLIARLHPALERFDRAQQRSLRILSRLRVGRRCQSLSSTSFAPSMLSKSSTSASYFGVLADDEDAVPPRVRAPMERGATCSSSLPSWRASCSSVAFDSEERRADAVR